MAIDAVVLALALAGLIAILIERARREHLRVLTAVHAEVERLEALVQTVNDLLAGRRP